MATSSQSPRDEVSVDVEVANHGSLFTFELLTDDAREWWSELIEWHGAKVVEPRYAYDLAHGMLDDGLVVQ